VKKRITALLLATSTLFMTVSPVAAYSRATYGPYPRDLSGYHYYVEVCVHSNTGSSTWNTGVYPFHARLNSAMLTWNAAGPGELAFAASNSCVATDTYILVKYGNISGTPTGQFTAPTLPCLEPWGNVCWRNATITVNNVDHTVYTGTGTPPAGQKDLQSIVTHELGHAFLSEDNDNPAQQTMASSLPSGTTWMRTLTSGAGSDIAGYCDAFNAC
jgi:hypothetical protein